MMNAGPESVAEIVALAGGRLVGKTRLQKVTYLLELAGIGYGFRFTYHHYGPYSEELSWAAREGEGMDILREKEERAAWGGVYSVFETTVSVDVQSGANALRKVLVEIACASDAVALELAATVALLATRGEIDPWHQVSKLKPQKAAARLGEAKALYEQIASVEVPTPFPRAA